MEKTDNEIFLELVGKGALRLVDENSRLESSLKESQERVKTLERVVDRTKQHLNIKAYDSNKLQKHEAKDAYLESCALIERIYKSESLLSNGAEKVGAVEGKEPRPIKNDCTMDICRNTGICQKNPCWTEVYGGAAVPQETKEPSEEQKTLERRIKLGEKDLYWPHADFVNHAISEYRLAFSKNFNTAKILFNGERQLCKVKIILPKDADQGIIIHSDSPIQIATPTDQRSLSDEAKDFILAAIKKTNPYTTIINLKLEGDYLSQESCVSLMIEYARMALENLEAHRGGKTEGAKPTLSKEELYERRYEKCARCGKTAGSHDVLGNCPVKDVITFTDDFFEPLPSEPVGKATA